MEVEAGDAEALAEVEGVGLLTLGAGVEREGVAGGGPGVIDEPLEHGAAVAEGAGVGMGDEVVDVEGLAGGEHEPGAEAGDGGDETFVLEGGEVKAFKLLGVDARDELILDELGAELAEDREAAEDFGLGGGEVDGGHGLSGGYQFSRRRRLVMWAV